MTEQETKQRIEKLEEIVSQLHDNILTIVKMQELDSQAVELIQEKIEIVRKMQRLNRW